MIEPTDEMRAVVLRWRSRTGALAIDVVTELLALVERDYDVLRKPTPEQVAAWPKPKRRLRACVERWPGAEIEGDYDPRCCRFPKSCSASVYRDGVPDEDLEPEFRP